MPSLWATATIALLISTLHCTHACLYNSTHCQCSSEIQEKKTCIYYESGEPTSGICVVDSCHSFIYQCTCDGDEICPLQSCGSWKLSTQSPPILGERRLCSFKEENSLGMSDCAGKPEEVRKESEMASSLSRMDSLLLQAIRVPTTKFLETHRTESTSSQGTIWMPISRRKYSGKMRPNSPSIATRKKPSFLCENWAVITSIFEPTQTSEQLANLENWCLVVVGDRRTPTEPWRKFAELSRATHFLSVSDQEALGYKILQHLKWDHFGRKNVGYLYAIEHGAKFIWDTDDDNELKDGNLLASLLQKNNEGNVSAYGNMHHLWNPYEAFNPVQVRTTMKEEICWPRGFPLEYLKNSSTKSFSIEESIPIRDIGVFQSLADNDPDVDAIYRLTKEIPLLFLSPQKIVSLRRGQYAPFNAQATLWTKQSFWGMLLPVTVHARVADIWRSYITERLMTEVGQYVSFTSPIVKQNRNPHNLIRDLQAEIPLYTQTNEFIKWLLSWNASQDVRALTGFIEKLAVAVYDIGIIEKEDVALHQAWLDDLESIGYKFPLLKQKPTQVKQSGTSRPIFHASTKVSSNVAVCVSGQVRTNSMSITDPEYPKNWRPMRTHFPQGNMTVAESIQRNLFPKLKSPDVFMYSSTLETPREPKVGDLSVCEPLRPPGGFLSCSVPKEENITKSNYDMWNKFTLKQENTSQGLLQQLNGMFECYQAAENHSRTTGKKYDWMVRLRPDGYIVSFPELETLLSDSFEPTVWYANKTGCCCGNEDWFGVAPMQLMKTYFERFLYLQQVKWDYPNRWNAELFLKKHLESHGIALKEHPDIHACLVKPKYRSKSSQP